MKNFYKLLKKKPVTAKLVWVLALLFSMNVSQSWGQQSITTAGSAVTQDFNGMGSSGTATLPTGFKIGTDWSTGATATTLAYGSTGTGVVTGTSSGGAINWANGITGSATERALGFLSTGSYTSPRSIIYAFTNNTGSTVTSISLSWNYEKYRSGSRAFDWTFFHGSTSTAATANSSGNQAYAADANNTTISNPPASTAKSFTISSLSIANGSTYYLRWTYTGSGGSTNGQGLAIDDFSITLTAATPSITGAATATAFTTTYGTASAAQTFSVSGSNLTANLVATAPTGFEVSSDGTTYGSTATFNQSGGSASGTLRIRLAATAAVSESYNSQNIVLSSTGATSVNITTAASGNSVTPKALSITAPSIASKVYDGSTTAGAVTVGTLSGFVGSQTVTATASAAAYSSANVGTYNSVVITYTLANGTNGGLAANYSLANGSATGQITAKALTITANNVNKTSGATLTGGSGSTAFTSSGLVGSETIGTVTISYGNGAAAGDPAGTYTGQVIPSAATGGTFNPSNYSISYVSGDIIISTSPTISGAATANAFTTIYGTPSAVQSFSISGSALTANLVATAPTGFEVSADGTTYGTTATFIQTGGSASGTLRIRLAATAAVSGSYNSQNIVLSSTGASSVNITTTSSGNSVSAKALTITGLSASDKIYDGNNTVSVTGTAAYSGLVNGETFSVSGSVTWTFPDANVGSNKTLTLSGSYTAPSTNYSITQPSLTASITAKALSITAPSIASKAYDGTTTAGAVTVGTLSGFVGTQTVTATGAAANYSNANAGTYPGVVITYTLSNGTNGGLAANYSLANGSATGVITPKALTISGATASNKIYNGNNVATITGTLSGVISPDVVTLSLSGTFASANVGTGIAVTSTSTLGGANAGNYTLTQPTGLTANITAIGLTISGLSGVNKVYDGNTTATTTGTATLNGVLPADAANVTLGGTPVRNFNNANVGTGKPITITGYSISGTASGNYTLSQPTGLTANITAIGLTISGLTGVNKVYDGNTTATTTGTATLNGVLPADAANVTLGGTPVRNFNNANVGTGKPITITGYSISGTASGNYTLSQPTGLTANITAKALTITANGVTKYYGDALTGGAGSTAFTSSGLISGETIGSVTITYGTGAAAGDAVGTYSNQVTPSAATGVTFTASNYSITYVAGSITVLPAAITFDNTDNWIQGSLAFGSYSNHSYSQSNWLFEGNLVIRNGTAAQDGFPGALGTYSWRLQDAAGSSLTATFNSSATITAFSFDVRRWDDSPNPSYTVEFSTNSGGSWTNTGTTINNTFLGSSDWKLFSYTLPGAANVTSGQFKVRIVRSGGERIMIDNFSWSGTNEIRLTTMGTAVTEDFNTLIASDNSSVILNGWYISESGTAANTSIAGGTGSSSTGNTYSFGTSRTDRALGGLQSGSLVPTIGAKFVNNTGSTITGLDISYTGETWRVGATGRADRLDFQYSTNATSLTTGTWIDVDDLDYQNISHGVTSSGSMIHSANISNTITGLSIANGTTFWIRWIDFNASGSNDGMGIDDFSITPINCTSPNSIAFVNQPSNVQQDVAMSAVTVRAFCTSTGLTATGFTGNITLTASDGGCGYVSQTVAALNGVATFDNIIFTRSTQNGISLTASASGFTNVVSNTFNVTAPPGALTTVAAQNFDGTNTLSYSTTVGGAGVFNTSNTRGVSNSNCLAYYYNDCLTGASGSSSTATFTQNSGFSGLNNVKLSFAMAWGGPQLTGAGTACDVSNFTGQGLDSDDFVRLETRINGGSYVTTFQINGFSNKTYGFSSSGVTLNHNANQTLSYATEPSAFTINLPAGVSTVEFRFTFKLNRRNELVYLDNFSLTGAGAGVPLALPTANAGISFSGCNGGANQLQGSATNTVGAIAYSWSPSASLDNASISNPVASNTATTTYTLTVADGDNCSANSTVTVSVLNGTPGLWTGAENTDWFNCQNWASGSIPSSSTNVVIPDVINDPEIAIGTATCNDFTINNSAFLNMTETASLLNVSGNFNNNGSLIPGTGTIVFVANSGTQTIATGGIGSGKVFNNITKSGNGTAALAGDMQVNNNFNLSAGTFDVSTNNYALNVGGNWSNSATFTPRNGTVTFNGTGTQTITTGGTGAGKPFNNVTKSGNGTALLSGAMQVNNNFSLSEGTFDVSTNNYALNVGGNWTNSATFAPRNGTVTFNGVDAQSITTGGSGTGKQFYNVVMWQEDGIITINDDIQVNNDFTSTYGFVELNGAMNVSNNFTLTEGYLSTNNNPLNVGGNWNNNATFNPGFGTVTFNGSGAQTIATGGTGNGKEFYNVTTDKSGGTASLSAAMQVNNNFTLAGGTFDVSTSNHALNVGGNWTNSATFTPRNGTVTFNGTTNQDLNNSGTGQFFNLALNKTAGNVNLLSGAQARNQLSMFQGNITTNAHTLNLGVSATNPGTLNYTSGKVIGSMRRWFAASTNTGAGSGLYPLGNATNELFVTVEYTTAPTVGGSLTGTFINDDMADFGVPANTLNIPAVGSCPPFEARILSDQGFWQMDDADGLSGGEYDITFDAQGFETITDICALTALKRIGAGEWAESGTHIEVIGDTDRPVVKRTSASGWSNWGYAGGDVNPLPISLIDFNAKAVNNEFVELNWVTASEINNDFFTVERSLDAMNFTPILDRQGAGNSNSVLSYLDYDRQPYSGISYYRLKQTDFNGDFSYSNIVAVQFNSKKEFDVVVFGNSSNNEIPNFTFTHLNNNVKIEVCDASGRIVMIKNIAKADANVVETLNFQNLKQGIYFMRFISGDKTVVKRWMR